MAGGAWKVAYADFITAMMALFMVLWILGSEDELLEQLEEYFKNPPSPFTRESTKFDIISDEGDRDASRRTKSDVAYFESFEPTILRGIVSEFKRVLNMEGNEKEPAVEVILTSDGLRVSFYDKHEAPLFERGGARLTTWADFLVQNLAWLIARYPFDIVVESFAFEKPLEGSGHLKDGESSWELSTRRANIMRRRLQFYANDQLNFRSVVGFGDVALFSEEELETGSGRMEQRISLSLSLADRGHLPDFSMVGEGLLPPARQEQEKPSATYD